MCRTRSHVCVCVAVAWVGEWGLIMGSKKLQESVHVGGGVESVERRGRVRTNRPSYTTSRGTVEVRSSSIMCLQHTATRLAGRSHGGAVVGTVAPRCGRVPPRGRRRAAESRAMRLNLEVAGGPGCPGQLSHTRHTAANLVALCRDCAACLPTRWQVGGIDTTSQVPCL